jgi:cell cycle arrest protein BUB3
MSAPVAAAAATEQQQFALANPPSDGVSQVVWANASSGPASELLLASSWDRSLRLYDAAHNLCRLQVDLPGAVLDCAFDTSDTTAFAVGIDRAVTAVDLATANTRVLGYHNNTSRCLVWHAATGLLFSGGWDGKLLCWDPRAPSRPAGSSSSAGIGAVGAATPVEGEKILTMGLSGHRLIVGTSKRHVLIYDIRTGFSSANAQPEQRRESSLLNQTRCIRGFPDTTGYALSSIEGRVAIEYFNPDPNVQKNKYAFKVSCGGRGTED